MPSDQNSCDRSQERGGLPVRGPANNRRGSLIKPQRQSSTDSTRICQAGSPDLRAAKVSNTNPTAARTGQESRSKWEEAQTSCFVSSEKLRIQIAQRLVQIQTIYHGGRQRHLISVAEAKPTSHTSPCALLGIRPLPKKLTSPGVSLGCYPKVRRNAGPYSAGLLSCHLPQRHPPPR